MISPAASARVSASARCAAVTIGVMPRSLAEEPKLGRLSRPYFGAWPSVADELGLEPASAAGVRGAALLFCDGPLVVGALLFGLPGPGVAACDEAPLEAAPCGFAAPPDAAPFSPPAGAAAAPPFSPPAGAPVAAPLVRSATESGLSLSELR